MGGHNFEDIAFGKNVDDAYRNACEQATWECGHDAYNGTISTTQGYTIIERHGRKLSTIEDDVLNNPRFEKWGRCAAVVLKGKEARDYRESHNLQRKKGVVVFFCGWAAS